MYICNHMYVCIYIHTGTYRYVPTNVANVEKIRKKSGIHWTCNDTAAANENVWSGPWRDIIRVSLPRDPLNWRNPLPKHWMKMICNFITVACWSTAQIWPPYYRHKCLVGPSESSAWQDTSPGCEPLIQILVKAEFTMGLWGDEHPAISTILVLTNSYWSKWNTKIGYCKRCFHPCPEMSNILYKPAGDVDEQNRADGVECIHQGPMFHRKGLEDGRKPLRLTCLSNSHGMTRNHIPYFDPGTYSWQKMRRVLGAKPTFNGCIQILRE